LSQSVKEYNRLAQQRHREKEKELEELYKNAEINGISFTEFKKEIKQSTWNKISIALSDDELKLVKLSLKFSDQEIRKRMKGNKKKMRVVT
jgi:hypothetical protein